MTRASAIQAGEAGIGWDRGCSDMFQVDMEKCNGCGTCVDVCSQGVISLRDVKAAIDHICCVECGMCFNGKLVREFVKF